MAKPSASLQDLIDRLLEGGPRQATDAYAALSKLVTGGLDVAPLLENQSSQDDKRRFWIGRLVASAHRRHGRMRNWRAWLERCDDDRVIGGELMALGNSRREDVSAYLPLAIERLRRPDSSAELCESALYFLARLGERQPSAIGAAAREAITARLDDDRRVQLGTVAKSARQALAAAGAAPAKKPVAKKAPRTDPRVTKATRELGDAKATVRARAAGRLVSLLSGDMIDIRTSFGALAKALGDTSAPVRRAAALATYYAFDLQGGIDELRVLEEPLARAARDADAKVREHASAALAAARRATRRH